MLDTGVHTALRAGGGRWMVVDEAGNIVVPPGDLSSGETFACAYLMSNGFQRATLAELRPVIALYLECKRREAIDAGLDRESEDRIVLPASDGSATS